MLGSTREILTCWALDLGSSIMLICPSHLDFAWVQFFSKLSDSIRYITAQHGHPYLQNYIDDLLYCGLPSKIHSAYEFLLQLLQKLGLDIAPSRHPGSLFSYSIQYS